MFRKLVLLGAMLLCFTGFSQINVGGFLKDKANESKDKVKEKAREKATENLENNVKNMTRVILITPFLFRQ